MSRKLLLNVETGENDEPHLFVTSYFPQFLLDESPHIINVTGDLEYEALYYDQRDMKEGYA